MVDGTEQGGTPGTQPDDANGGTLAPPTDGATAEVDWKARAEELDRKFQQSLVEKTHLEEERQRRRELEAELDRVRSSGYGAAPATAGNPYAEAAARMQQNYLALQGSDDPRDQMLIASLNFQQQLQAELRFNNEMATIPPAEQKAVAERARRDGLSPTLALKVIHGERYDSERTTLEDRRRRLDEEEEARKRGRVDMTTTPIPARAVQNGDFASPDEYAEACQQAERGNQSAIQRLRDFDNGLVRIRS